MTERPRPKRVARSATVVRTEQLSPAMVRVVLGGPDLAALPELEFTDHYVKLLFAPAGAGYAWPFDPDEIRASRPAEQWPVTRTYTIRWFDREAGELAIDFVVHGDAGLAAPWAAQARPGDEIGFFGPGGGYVPEPGAAHLLAGDEAALPAIAAALDRLPADAEAEVYVEVAGPADELPLRVTDKTRLTWVHRGDAPYGAPLARAVRSGWTPGPNAQVFVHGNAELVRDLRRFLFVEHRLDRRAVSISGYWRTGYTEERWQSTKRELVEQMERDEAAAAHP
ncbi:siderophore-interacting protein [Microlunatus ginsengisoli]|uniref:Siderophore-interacting protein n=1 Tax=Microlunatus ginsengisoli TaxID=363863 RepID=A0ABP6ZI95_9ACTN